MPIGELGLAPRRVMQSLPSKIEMGCRDGQASGRWFVVQTEPRAESLAIAYLERQGYRVFCPRLGKTVRHARRVKRVLAPLFPNYLFLQLDASRDLWRAINGTRGAVRLISQGETSAPVPHRVVESLLARVRDDGAIDWAPLFKIGQAVRIADRPFADLVGTLEHLDGAGRVHVLLELLGRIVPVALRCEALMKAA